MLDKDNQAIKGNAAMKRARQILELFLQFMKFGLFTFGGGWSIIA
ncbi:MAG: hypothetical protein ACLUN5_17595 [Oscillospiraceae bacterium]